MIGGQIIQHVPRDVEPEVPSAIDRYLDWQRRYHARSPVHMTGSTGLRRQPAWVNAGPER